MPAGSHRWRLGGGARATKTRAVAIGDGSLANVANTVSVGTTAARRRIVNVAPAIADSDAATLGQAKALAAAAASEAVVATGKSQASDDVRREMDELRAMVSTLRQELSELQRRNTVAQNE